MAFGVYGVEFKLDGTKFNEALKQFQAEVGIDVSDIIRWQMGQWANDLIKRTEPGNMKDVGFASMSMQRVFQKERVENDIAKVFTAPKTTADWDGVGKKAGQHGLKLKSGAVIFVAADKWQPDAANLTMKHEHWKHRQFGPRRGRTIEPSQKDKMATKHDTLTRYIAWMQNDIGKTKSGWTKAADYFATRSKGAVKMKAPEWVTRHVTFAAEHGVYSDTLDAKSMTGEATIGNNTPWGNDSHGMMAFTLNNRKKFLERYGVKHLDRICKKFSAFGRAA